VIIGATRLAQLQDTLCALDFTLDAELTQRLDAASDREPSYPYTFFEPQMQAMVHGGVAVGDKPSGYRPRPAATSVAASLRTAPADR